MWCGLDGNLRAILYVGGQAATCERAQDSSLRVTWHEKDGVGGPIARAFCGRYRWTRFIPGYFPEVMLSAVAVLFLARRALHKEQERLKAEEERKRLEVEEEELKRQRIEGLLRRDAVGDEINYMSGPEFERFMADVFRQKGYDVQETKSTGDQGVDLLLDIDDKKVAVQLKRWTGPVGNKAVQATFAGMAHYAADEGWIITTSTFTKSARELARSTRVRLIDGKELGDWLEGLREQG